MDMYHRAMYAGPRGSGKTISLIMAGAVLAERGIIPIFTTTTHNRSEMMRRFAAHIFARLGVGPPLRQGNRALLIDEFYSYDMATSSVGNIHLEWGNGQENNYRDIHHVFANGTALRNGIDAIYTSAYNIFGIYGFTNKAYGLLPNTQCGNCTGETIALAPCTFCGHKPHASDSVGSMTKAELALGLCAVGRQVNVMDSLPRREGDKFRNEYLAWLSDLT